MTLNSKLQVGLLLLCHAMLEVSCLDSQTCEAIVPVDSTAKLGENAVLKCRLSSQNIAWTFCPVSGEPRLISNNCAVVKSASSSYKVDKSNNGCDLVIDNVTASHLGAYTCQDLSLSDTGHTVKLGNTKENLALHKKTIQSTTLAPTAESTCASNLAVDGNSDAEWTHGSCTHTINIAPEWWAVDLEQEVAVGHIRLTNMLTVDARMQNIFIGTTNISPWVTPPTNFNQTSVCKYFFGYPPGGKTISIYCEPDTAPGRYLFVLMDRADYLNICELEVYHK